uniref:Fe2OG dioxygenase domain-containing protein n=1 Tax=Alexandrium catenella TaxID=2925 RepID=A0A7S1M347_ALECA
MPAEASVESSAPPGPAADDEPAWVEEEVEALRKWAESQACGFPPLLAKVRKGFDEAVATAREACRSHREFVRLQGGDSGGMEMRRAFSGDLGRRVRLAAAAATDGLFAEVCLLPGACRDERARAILTAERLSELESKRVLVVDWALKPKEVLAARKEAEALDAAGKLAPHLGHNIGATPVHRGDRITWVKGSGEGPLADVVRLLQGLAAELEAGTDFGELHVPPEAMLACYPGSGTHYTRHVDSVGEDPRCVTCIFYLQTLAYRSEVDGGELRVTPPGESSQKVEAKGGRLVIFDSRTVEHEVLPARSSRMAVTLWLRRRPPTAPSVAAAMAGAGVEGAGDGAAGAAPPTEGARS